MYEVRLVSAVKLGAKLLDRKLPGWEKRINFRKLRMDSWSKCIVGQACYGGYNEARELLLGKGQLEDSSVWLYDVAVKYGMHPGSINERKELIKAWKAEVGSRLKKTKSPSVRR